MLKDTNPKDAVGVRKWRQYCTVPITVIWELGVAMLEGARKYGRHNYRVAGVRASVYVDAAKGHIDSWWEGEDLDPDSGLSHVTKAMASLAVLRDAMINEMVTDDRPPKVKDFAGFREGLQRAVESIMDRHPDAREPFTELGERAKDVLTGPLTGVAHAAPSSDVLAGRRVDEAPTWNASEADFVDQAILATQPVERRCAYVVAHRDLSIEFVHPDHPEFDRMHVWGGLTTKQLCNLVRAEAKDGEGCGMNHACLTGNLAIYRPDIFDRLLRRVVDRISQQDTFECRLDFPGGGFRECSTRLSSDDWAIAVPGIKVTGKGYHGVMKPKGDHRLRVAAGHVRGLGSASGSWAGGRRSSVAALHDESFLMLPLRISNATRILAETQDEYYALAILDEVVDGQAQMTSVWEPSPKELADLNAGGAVRLTIVGKHHPPVMITTQGPPG